MKRSSIANKIGFISVITGLLFLVIIGMFFYMQGKLKNQILSQDIQIELSETQSLITEFHFKKSEDKAEKIVDMKSQLWSKFENFGNLPSIGFIKENTEKFFSLFDRFYEIAYELGLDEKQGAQGEFRKAIHDVQEQLKALGKLDIEILLLEMRRREKDYMLRRESKYIDDVSNLTNKINQKIEASPSISNEKKESIINLVTNYRNTFNKYAELYTESEKVKKQLDNQFEYLQTLGEGFSAKQKSQTQAAKNTMFITIFFTVLVAIGLTIWQSKRIIQPIKELRDSADKVANGDTSIVISKSDTKDEIWDLAESFEKLIKKNQVDSSLPFHKNGYSTREHSLS